jgi:peptide-methionine (R)-S-oxide reductase
MEKLTLTESQWRARLSPEQYHVLREAGTERAFAGELNHNKATGHYDCAGCGNPLFTSARKYDSGSGWPSFTAPVTPESVSEHVDMAHGMRRVEIRCAKCDGHLGHVFEDGPQDETGLRYCMNSLALDFKTNP